MTLKYYMRREHMKIAGKNPITELDYPDPDVIRVDDTYYMVSTTMHFMPGCEILRSYDLIHWEHLSYVYERLDSTEEQRLVGEKNCYGKGMASLIAPISSVRDALSIPNCTICTLL